MMNFIIIGGLIIVAICITSVALWSFVDIIMSEISPIDVLKSFDMIDIEESREKIYSRISNPMMNDIYTLSITKYDERGNITEFKTIG